MRTRESEQYAWKKMSVDYTRAGGGRVIELAEDLSMGLDTYLQENEGATFWEAFVVEVDNWWLRNRDLELHQYHEVLFLLTSFWEDGEELTNQLSAPINLMVLLTYKEKMEAVQRATEEEEKNRE